MPPTLSSLILWAILIGSAAAGWRLGGWRGLVVGFLAGFPIGLATIVTLSLALIGLARLAGRKSGIGKLMIVTLVAALWLGGALAMVRASKTRKQRDQAILVAVLCPIGCALQEFIGRWVDRRSSPKD